MTRIRIAIIGLSSSAKTAWASSAHLPYLLSARGLAKYQIVALCNSSKQAAERAISAYKLPKETKAYGDPESLASDQDVDLVVCCTRVDVHFSTILPSVKAGKAVYVEWPLAENEDTARELVKLAKESGSRTIVGLQGRVAPVVVKLQDLIHEGRIGRVLSSEIRAAGGTVDRLTLSSGLKYFTQREVGGNPYTIGFGHLFDQIQQVLGDLQNLEGHFHLQRPNVEIKDTETGKIIETVRSNVPDFIVATGSLAATSDKIQQDARVLYRFRRGQPFVGEPPLVWTISGEKGEIRLQALGGTTLHASAYSQPVTVEIDDFSGKVEQVAWEWADWQEELPINARSVGLLYERFAEGGAVPSFEDALVRHEQLDRMIKSWAN